MQPAAAHALRAHVCGLSGVFSEAHVPGKKQTGISFCRLRTAKLCRERLELHSLRSARLSVSLRAPGGAAGGAFFLSPLPHLSRGPVFWYNLKIRDLGDETHG